MISYEEPNSQICKKLFYDRYKMYYELAVGKIPDSCSFWDEAKRLYFNYYFNYVGFSFVRAIPCIVVLFFLISPTYSQDVSR